MKTKMNHGVYTFFLSIGVGAREGTFDLAEYIDKPEWESLSLEEREKLLEEWLQDWAGNYIETWFAEDVAD